VKILILPLNLKNRNLIEQNLRICGRTKNCSRDFVFRDDVDLLVLFTDTMKANLIKNCLFAWATVPGPKITLSLMVLDYKQNWVPIVQTYDHTVANLFRVMTCEMVI
jgi:hypothetical protein